MKLIIEDDEGGKKVVPVVRDEITIGRQDGNTIKLSERNVSRKHARIWKDTGSLVNEDLGSYNGVRVNGDKIAGPTPVKEGDLIEIGDYDLGIQGKFEASTGAPAAAPVPTPAKASPAAAPKAAAAAPAPPPSKPAPVAAAPAPAPAPAPAAAPSMDSPMGMGGAGGATAIININKLMAAQPQNVEVRDLPKAEMPRLVGLAGAFYKKEFYLMRTEWKFGRTEDNDMALDHQSVSRQHGKFVLEAEGWKVFDNKSGNGVKVNGEEYVAVAVKPGDNIELGHVKFRFCAPGEKFTPPPEKAEGAPAAPSKALPSAAEMMAGKAGPAPKSSAPAKAAAGGKLPIPLIGGIVAVVVIGIVVAVMMSGGKEKGGGSGGGEAGGTGATGGDAYKQAQAAAAKKDFNSASDLAEKAGDKAPAAFKAKMAAEAAGQEAFEKLEAALASGNGDAAMAAFEKCASESTFYCEKVKAREDAVKASFAKKHLDAARAAKGSNPTACTEAVAKVLARDPNNQEAQAIQGECSPAQAVKAPAAPSKPAASEGPSQKQRDDEATKIIADAIGKVQGGDPGAGVVLFKKCIALKPSKELLGRCWKNLGVSQAKSGDTDGAKESLKKYLNFCGDDCDQIKALITRFGG